jgi:predicted secreted protein
MTVTRSVGTKIQIGANFVANITSISGLELSADTIDTTALDSTGGYREFIGGFKDAGEVGIQGYFDPGDTGQSALYTAFQLGSTDSYSIIFPASLGASWTFSGVVTGFKTGADLEEALSFEGTIKVSGQPTLNLTASANLTALALTGTAGTLSPAYASGTYAYSYSFTGTALTVTATLAGATYDVYVDGALFQAGIASGAASNTITFSAVGSKKVTVIERESGKSPKIYDVVAIRTA